MSRSAIYTTRKTNLFACLCRSCIWSPFAPIFMANHELMQCCSEETVVLLFNQMCLCEANFSPIRFNNNRMYSREEKNWKDFFRLPFCLIFCRVCICHVCVLIYQTTACSLKFHLLSTCLLDIDMDIWWARTSLSNCVVNIYVSMCIHI